MIVPPTYAQHFQALDHVPVGICIIDTDYHIVFWNRCLTDWTGNSTEKTAGSLLGDLYPHFSETRYTLRIDTILAGGPPAIFSSQLHGHLFPAQLPNNTCRTLHTTVSSVPGPDRDERLALFVIKDVTELTRQLEDIRELQRKAVSEIEQRKRTEQELLHANQTILEQQNARIEEERLEVLLQMAGATAHELNQPLMALMGYLEILELGHTTSEKYNYYIRKTRETGDRIARTIKKIQNIRYHKTKPHDPDNIIIDLDEASKKNPT